MLTGMPVSYEGLKYCEKISGNGTRRRLTVSRREQYAMEYVQVAFPPSPRGGGTPYIGQRGGSARKGYLFQVLDLKKGKDFTS